MRKLLSALFNNAAPSQVGPRIKAELADITVSVQSYKVILGSSADDKLEEGLTNIVNKLAAIYQTHLQSQIVTGMITYRFKLESDGIIRTVLEIEKAVTSGDLTQINDEFIRAAMAKQVQFPSLGQSTTVEAKFKFERK